jgi:hypothetical protein
MGGLESLNLEEIYPPLMYAGAGLVGLLSCFLGHKLFKMLVVAVMAVAGAASLAYLGYHYGDEPVLWSIGGLAVGTVLGAVLALFFYKFAVAVIGSFFAVTTVLPWVTTYELWLQWSILGVVGILSALIALAVTTFMIKLATAMLGGFLLAYGIRFFVTGEAVHEVVEASGEWILILDFDPVWSGSALAVGIFGFLLQSRKSD